MAAISPDALLGAAVVVALAISGALWKLATMIAEIRTEIRHNGGGSLKDHIHNIGRTVETIQGFVQDAKTTLDRLDTRITDHRRRNDQQIGALREYIQARLDDAEQNKTLIAVLTELGYDMDLPRKRGKAP
jgi:hypothetical protein